MASTKKPASQLKRTVTLSSIKELAAQLEVGKVVRVRGPYNLNHIEDVLKELLETDVERRGKKYYRSISTEMNINIYTCNVLEEMGIEVERHWCPLDTDTEDYTVMRICTDKDGKPLKPLNLSILEE